MITRLAIAVSLALAGSASAAPPPRADTGARGAVQLVRTYFALVHARRFGAARQMWGGNAIGPRAFAAAFARYRDYRGVVGVPGMVEGAAGSSYVEIPVRIHGLRRSGAPFSTRGTIVLRRVNDVPGSTPAQRRWHIERSNVEPRLAAE